MATVNRDFIIKNGLVVQGTTATVKGSNVVVDGTDIHVLSGTLSMQGGGTNANLIANAGGIVYSANSALAISNAAVASGHALISGTSGLGQPTWKQLELTDLPESSFKESVRVATTANITLSGIQTIDTVTLVEGDRVLVKNQTTTSQNGIYIVSSGAWTRATDANSSSRIGGAVVSIDSGNQSGQLWTTSFATTSTIESNAISWSRVVDTSLTANDTRAGIVELATNTETQDGQSTTLAVTPAGLASLEGYRFVQTVPFTSSGEFVKGTYPWLRAIRVRCVGGGGGGGGVGTTSGVGVAGGGGGGGIAESFITDISGLASPVEVQVGGGGAGGVGSNTGSTGGTSSFGSISAGGGEGGNPSGGNNVNNAGGNGGTASGGDLNLPGLAAPSASRNAAGPGGGYGGANRPTGSANGNNGTGTYGGGGSGAQDATTVERTGGAGAGGMVIVELYA